MGNPAYIIEGRWKPSAAQRKVVENAFAAYGFSPLAIRGGGRKARVSQARFAAAWALRARWGARLSWPMIAYLVGRRDHSTAMHAAAQAELRRERDPKFRAVTDALLAGAPVPISPDPVPDACRAGRPRKPTAPRPTAPLLSARCVMPKNDFNADDRDGWSRSAGTDRLLTALRREHPERCAA